jgi:hypothetical protein
MWYDKPMENATATLPQEDWDLILALLHEHSEGYLRQLDLGMPSTSYNELLTNAIAETDDLYFRIQQQVGQ